MWNKDNERYLIVVETSYIGRKTEFSDEFSLERRQVKFHGLSEINRKEQLLGIYCDFFLLL